LINAFPGNSYVNTVQHATIDEAVFPMSSAPSNSKNRVLCDQLQGYATILTIELFSVWSVPQNYAGNKQKSYKIIIMRMFAILDKAKHDIESIRGLNLAAVRHTTVQVTRLPL
jgi:hypothetical protein